MQPENSYDSAIFLGLCQNKLHWDGWFSDLLWSVNNIGTVNCCGLCWLMILENLMGMERSELYEMTNIFAFFNPLCPQTLTFSCLFLGTVNAISSVVLLLLYSGTAVSWPRWRVTVTKCYTELAMKCVANYNINLVGKYNFMCCKISLDYGLIQHMVWTTLRARQVVMVLAATIMRNSCKWVNFYLAGYFFHLPCTQNKNLYFLNSFHNYNWI